MTPAGPTPQLNAAPWAILLGMARPSLDGLRVAGVPEIPQFIAPITPVPPALPSHSATRGRPAPVSLDALAAKPKTTTPPLEPTSSPTPVREAQSPPDAEDRRPIRQQLCRSSTGRSRSLGRWRLRKHPRRQWPRPLLVHGLRPEQSPGPTSPRATTKRRRSCPLPRSSRSRAHLPLTTCSVRNALFPSERVTPRFPRRDPPRQNRPEMQRT